MTRPGASTLFIVGCGRSGTTAMADLLNADPRILVGVEAFKTNDQLFRADLTLDGVLASLPADREDELRARAASDALRYFGNKSPKSYKRLEWLAREFPDAKFLYMIRDLVPVASSWNVRARVKKNWPATDDYQQAVVQWNHALKRLAHYATQPFADRIFPVRYEWFFSGDRAYFDAMLRFLELEPNEALLASWEASSEGWSRIVDKPLLLDEDERAYLREHRDIEKEARALELCARSYLRYGEADRIGSHPPSDAPVVLDARLSASSELSRVLARIASSSPTAGAPRGDNGMVEGVRAAVGRPKERARRSPQARRSPRDLPDLGIERALLLQGPPGPFMRRFADELETAGVGAHKVNFHAGDAHFFPGSRAVSYQGEPAGFETWVAQLMDDLGADGLVLYDDCRPLHRAAIEVAERRGAKVWVFGEGYLRPSWITLEEHGVGGHSRIERDPEAYRSLRLAEPRDALPVGRSAHLEAWYRTVYAALASRPAGETAGPEPSGWREATRWGRFATDKLRSRRADRALAERCAGELSGRYTFVALQEHDAGRVAHSGYADAEAFVDEVFTSFGAHADRGDALVLGLPPEGADADELLRTADVHGLSDRVFVGHDLHLPTALKHARATVTIDSPVGLSALANRTPVKAMGDAVYDMPGLTFQGPLDALWGGAPEPDRTLYEQFRRYLLRTSQANGSFYKRVDPSSPHTGVRWPAGAESEKP